MINYVFFIHLYCIQGKFEEFFFFCQLKNNIFQQFVPQVTIGIENIVFKHFKLTVRSYGYNLMQLQKN